jgi:metal-sulfur cluster biosynthetic enzyme
MIGQPANNNRPVWTAEKHHPELCEKLREAFTEVVDPEIGLNIIQLGLIRDVRIEPDNALIKMILTTPFCPYGPAMLETTRQKAESVLDLTTNIDLGMDPWDFSFMEEGLGAEWGLY